MVRLTAAKMAPLKDFVSRHTKDMIEFFMDDKAGSCRRSIGGVTLL
ncbi:hypothetical protein OROMI_014025 [Orobanche minor]